jgi:hypothetical protein
MTGKPKITRIAAGQGGGEMRGNAAHAERNRINKKYESLPWK